MMTAHLMMDVDYPGRDDHVTKLLDFLRGCKRIRSGRPATSARRWIS